MTLDPYRVLGLDAGASQAEVKRAYRRLAKALHPDAAGEGALPAFLAVQEAYERLTGTKVRTVRPASGWASAPPASPGGTRTRAGAEPFREPWRADPARARAAREQARSRAQPRWPGSRPGDAGFQGGGATAPGSTPGRKRSPGGAAPGAAAGDGAAAPGATGGARAGTGTRRRATRKATLGSTTYDEARDPADRSWAGASWYGPTTGEYWIVNPREYADPRKHGPGYTTRGRTGVPAEAGEDPPAGQTGATSPRDGTDPDAVEGGSAPSGGAEEAQPISRNREAPIREPGAPSAPTTVLAAEPSASTGGLLGALGHGSSDPVRRLGLALLAWTPIGLVAATLIGGATGCLSYSASCVGTEPFLPWLAQPILLGILLLLPPLAEVLAIGTAAALVALIPGAAVITALGGSGSTAGPPVLAGWLGIAWLVGVAFGVRRAVRPARPSLGVQ